jgi:hypothetical protein
MYFCETLPQSGAPTIESKPETWQLISQTSSPSKGPKLIPLNGTFSVSFGFPELSLSSFVQSPVEEEELDSPVAPRAAATR